MSFAEMLRWTAAAAAAGVLVWAGVTDMRSRRIPNKAVLAMLGPRQSTCRPPQG